MTRKVGCDLCRNWCLILVSRGLPEPHADLSCSTCHTSEFEVYRAVDPLGWELRKPRKATGGAQ
jgi:hypothetical protein